MKKSGSESFGDETELEAMHTWQGPSDPGPDRASRGPTCNGSLPSFETTCKSGPIVKWY